MTELTDALRAALGTKPTAEGFTVAELVTQAGLPFTDRARLKIRTFLHGEIASGRVVAKMGRRLGISGNPVAVPIYLPVAVNSKKTK